MLLILPMVISHVDDLVHHFPMLLLTLFIKAAHLSKCRFTALLTRLTLSEIVAWLSVVILTRLPLCKIVVRLSAIIFLWRSWHGASPRTRHFFHSGDIFCKTHK